MGGTWGGSWVGEGAAECSRSTGPQDDEGGTREGKGTRCMEQVDVVGHEAKRDYGPGEGTAVARVLHVV